MTLSTEQLELRRKYIGSSDVPAILAMIPQSSPHAVWESKVLGIDNNGKPNDSADLGNRLEPFLIGVSQELIEAKAGCPVRMEYSQFVVDDDGICAANLDGIAYGDIWTASVECKTVSLLGYSPHHRDWCSGDSIPPHVRYQVQHQMNVIGAEYAFVVALIGMNGLNVFQVKSDPKIAEICRRVSHEFMTRYVIPKVPPPDYVPSWRALPETDGVIEPKSVPDSVAENFIECRRLRKEYVAKEDEAKRRVLSHMDGSTVGVCEPGMFTYNADKNGRRTLRFKPQ